MANGIIGIDHVLVGVADLEGARENWQRLGFTCTPRGRHLQRSTGNYCIMFPNDYVELIGIVDPEGPPSRLSDILRSRGDGLIGIALAPASAREAFERLSAAGLNPDPVVALSRGLELPEGTVEPRFALVELPPSATPDFRLFCCEHLTPELVRRPDWLKHANGVVGLRTISIVVDEPVGLAPAYGRLFGSGNTTLTDDTLTIFVGSYRILFVTHDDLQLLYPDVDLPDGSSGRRGGAISFIVPDPDRTAYCLRTADVPYRRSSTGSVHVAPDDGNGVLLEFASR